MNSSKNFRLFAAAGLTAVALSACSAASDPASEAPVALKPGEYRISMSGRAQSPFVGPTQTEEDVRDKVCLSGDDDAGKVSKLARNYFSMHPGCSHSPGDRVGNGLSGKVSCPTDPERMPDGKIAIEYTAALTAESVTLEGKMKFDLPTANMSAEEQQLMQRAPELLGKTSIVVKAERIGDC